MTPKELKHLRASYQLTQKQSAELIGIATRSWQRWEAGTRKINAGLIELFILKVENDKRIH